MKNIVIITNNSKDIGLVYTKKIVDSLSGRANVYMDAMFSVSSLDVKYRKTADLYKDIDLAVILGGDGTILQCAESCARQKIPMLGINLGTVGFMSEIDPARLNDAIDRLLNDDYRIEERMMLRIDVCKQGKHQGRFHALNDVVISKFQNSRLIGIDLYAGSEKVNSYIADGMILATPTGSTGYSLSAGGPVVDPMMSLFIATPICAHMLSARSCVLPADKPITIQIENRPAGDDAVVSVDGDIQCQIKSGDEVQITKSEHVVRLIKMDSRSFYDTLVMKL